MEIKLNKQFISFLRPELIIVYSFLFWILMFVIAPVDIKASIDSISLIYMIVSYLALFLGTQIISIPKNDVKNHNKYLKCFISINNLKKIYWISFCLGITGFIFYYIDLFFYKNVSFQNNILQNIYLRRSSDGSIFSTLANLSMYYSYIPITIDILCKNFHLFKIKIFSFLLFILLPVSNLFFGSRFGIIVPFIYLIIVFFSSYSNYKLNLYKLLIGGIIITFSFFYVVGFFFINRIENMNKEPIDALNGKASAFSEKVPVTKKFQNLIIKSKGTLWYPFLVGYVNSSQYTIHAVFEFSQVKNNVDNNNIQYMYGKATFPVFYKIYYKLFRISENYKDINTEVNKANARLGVWSTFFFYWYLDFGWFGIILFIFLGVIFKKFWFELYIHNNLLYLPLICLISIVVFLMLQLNYISNINQYVFISFISLPLFFNDKFFIILSYFYKKII